MDNEVAIRLDAGWSLYKRDRYREAVVAADGLLALNSDNPDAWWLRCAAVHALHQWEEVLASVAQLERIDPEYSGVVGWMTPAVPTMTPDELAGWILLSKGQALHRLRRYAEALVVFQRATERVPTEQVSPLAHAWIGVSRCLGRLKRASEAVEAARHAIEVDPTEAEAWFTLADNYRALHRRREALDALDRPLALDPYHPYAAGQRFLVLLRRAWHGMACARPGVCDQGWRICTTV